MSNIEEHIRQAMQEGKFDNLKNKGKRLPMEDNPLADPEWRLAHHMLHSSGFTLPWIETRQELEKELDAARTAIQQAWDWRREAIAARKHPKDLIEAEWARAERDFRQAISEVNKKIRAYNLEAPSSQVHLGLLNPDKELARFQEQDQGLAGE